MRLRETRFLEPDAPSVGNSSRTVEDSEFVSASQSVRSMSMHQRHSTPELSAVLLLLGFCLCGFSTSFQPPETDEPLSSVIGDAVKFVSPASDGDPGWDFGGTGVSRMNQS